MGWAMVGIFVGGVGDLTATAVPTAVAGVTTGTAVGLEPRRMASGAR